MKKEKLLKMITKKQEQKSVLAKQAETCNDVETLRNLNAELDGLNEELRGLQDVLEGVDNESLRNEQGQAERTMAVNGEIPGMVVASAQKRMNKDTNDMEYREAFRDYVLKGMPIPMEVRADANTLTTDVSAAIPTVLVNQIIEKVESIGMILPLVTKTKYPAGMKIPKSQIKPVATWVAEGNGSDRQKKSTGFISFTNHKLRCEISMSMEVGTMAISAFEASFVRQVSEAMVKAIEAKIVSTDAGTSSNKGILAETPAPGQAITATELSYGLMTGAEAALPLAYEKGAKWCMSKKTFMSFFGMTDADGHPIARVNYGIGAAPERVLLGREVVLCDYIDSFSADLAAGKIFAFLFDFSDYAFNTIYDMGIQRKQDWETEDLLTKAVMSVDGMVLDNNSLVTIAKAAASAG